MNLLRIPRMKFSLGKFKISNQAATLGVIALAGLGLWYFGVNPSTRQFDLLGMLKLPTLGPMANGQAPLDPIAVTESVKPSNVPPAPEDVQTSDLMVNTISNAYNTQVAVDDDITPRTVAGYE